MSWRRFLPWDGQATRADWMLLAAIAAVVAFGVALRPITPFLVASQPALLALLTGEPAAIGAAAAFARVDDLPIWPVLVAGAVGMAKFDWLTWWTGRQWGLGLIRVITTNPKVMAFAARAHDLPPWVLRLGVVVAGLPGLPTPVIYVMAGVVGMRLRTFMLLDLLGSTLITGTVAALGFAWGQGAVDVALMIDRYASAVSLGLIAAAVLVAWLRRWLVHRDGTGKPPAPPPADPAGAFPRGGA